VGLLFWNGRSIPGWLLTCAGAIFIFAGVIANMHTIIMLVLLVGGLGLIARSMRSTRGAPPE